MKNKIEKFIYHLLILFFEYALVFYFFPDHLDALGTILFVTVVCTAGVGLIVVIPVSLFVISLIVFINKMIVSLILIEKIEGFKLIIHKTKKGNYSKVPEYYISVVKYIVAARNEGKQDSVIRALLETGGWNKDDIDKSFGIVHKENLK